MPTEWSKSNCEIIKQALQLTASCAGLAEMQKLHMKRAILGGKGLQRIWVSQPTAKPYGLQANGAGNKRAGQ
jgi:hypothetical protein